MTVIMIAAAGRRGQLGLNGELPWHDPDDLAWFRKVTMGHTLVVGYNTAKKLPPLPGRYLRVMGRGDTPEKIMAEHAERGGGDLYIIGGAKTYATWMPHVDRCYINRVNYDGPADTWLPPLFPPGANPQ
jgi:dihydrofolate reductase